MEHALWIDFSLFLVMLGLLIYVFLRNAITPLHKVYLIFHGLMMLWPFCQFAMGTVSEPVFQLFYLKLSFIGLALLGEGWMIFTIFLTGQSYYLTSRTIVYLSLPAAVSVAAIVINPGGLFVEPIDGAYMERHYGPLFWLMIVLTLQYAFLSFHQLFRTIRSGAAPRHKQQIRMAITGLTILSGFAIADLTVNVILKGLIPSCAGIISVGILVSDLYFIVAIMRLKVFEIVTIARTNVIDSMSTGVLVLDGHDVILEVNKVMRSLGEFRIGDRIDIEAFLAPYDIEGDAAPFLEAYSKQPPEAAAVEVAFGVDRFRHATVSAAPIFDGRMHLMGRVLTIQDVSQLRLLVDASNRQNEVLQDRNRALLQAQEELFQANRKLEQMAITDSLTGCFNRRYMMQQLEHEVLTNLRYRIPFAIFLFDIDLFKNVNDTYGHQVGDEVLKSTADVVKNALRRTDILARYGGEEFTVYLPHTNKAQAEMLAERIKNAVQHNVIEGAGHSPVSITISIGVLAVDEGRTADIDNPKAYLRELFARTDAALYEAKRGGRNRIVGAGPGHKPGDPGVEISTR